MIIAIHVTRKNVHKHRFSTKILYKFTLSLLLNYYVNCHFNPFLMDDSIFVFDVWNY